MFIKDGMKNGVVRNFHQAVLHRRHVEVDVAALSQRVVGLEARQSDDATELGDGNVHGRQDVG